MGKTIDSDKLIKYVEKYERWANGYIKNSEVFKELVEEGHDDPDTFESLGYNDGCHDTCIDIAKDLRRFIEES